MGKRIRGKLLYIVIVNQQLRERVDQLVSTKLIPAKESENLYIGI